jgi:hypothetical protein
MDLGSQFWASQEFGIVTDYSLWVCHSTKPSEASWLRLLKTIILLRCCRLQTFLNIFSFQSLFFLLCPQLPNIIWTSIVSPIRNYLGSLNWFGGCVFNLRVIAQHHLETFLPVSILAQFFSRFPSQECVPHTDFCPQFVLYAELVLSCSLNWFHYISVSNIALLLR